MRDATPQPALEKRIRTPESYPPSTAFPVQGEIRGREKFGESLMKGRYSEVLVGPSIIEKRNVVDVGGEVGASAREADRRLADVNTYLSELTRAGVNVPQTTAKLDLGLASPPTIVIRSEKVPAPHNLIQLATAPGSQRCALIKGMLAELLKIVSTQNGETPIGYDSGLDNFVTLDGRCYLVDVYPPRLGFRTHADGTTSLLDKDTLLINYPERENLTLERQNQMRRFFYTPEGTIEHFATWAISAGLIGTEFRPDSHVRGDRYQEFRNCMVDEIIRVGREDLAQHLNRYLDSETGKRELAYRLVRTPQRLVDARKQWEAACQLF